MTTDTSTQAVEAHLAKYEAVCTEPCEFGFCKDCQIERDAMELLRALAAERDELVKAAIMQKAAYEGVSSMLLSVQKDCIAARRTALEDAAKVADRRAFYAFAKCERLGPTDPTTGMAECLHEANGEDCLCQQVHEDAENMAHAIRALIEEPKL